MFYHNFKYTMITLLKNKMLLFWTFAFPILLGTFFKMAFSDIEKNEMLDIIDIAIVDNISYQNNPYYKEAFKVLSTEEKMFNLKLTNESDAKDLLQNSKITGYLMFNENDIKIFVNQNGIDETILRFVVDELKSNNKIAENIIKDKISNEYKVGNYNINYEKIYNEALDLVNSASSNIKNITNSNLSYTMIEYYTLIAMAALYGGILSMYVVNKRLANMDVVGKRVEVSPLKKSHLLISSLLASLLVQIFGLALLFIYTIFVLKVTYGNNLILCIVLGIIGSIAGLSLGVFTSSIFKGNENTKIGILIAITMFASFLSGMMGITMKYIIDKNIPILNMINPANMITDGFYALYYYEGLERYLTNILSLIIFSIVLIFISYLSLRRVKYDSI